MIDRDSFWKVIPITAKAIALFVYAGLVILFYLMLMTDHQMRQWHTWQQALFSFLFPLVVPVYILFVGYVNGDSRRRGMRQALWTIIAALVPYAIGIIVYFVMRDPFLATCRNCGTQGRKGFAYCPQCGTALARACPVCRRAAENGWTHCAYCGCDLNAPVPQDSAAIVSPPKPDAPS